MASVRSALSLCAALVAAPAFAAPEASKHDVPGLAEEASIVIDRWGVPHIYAANRDDLFFLQGYNAARDRLWQIDLWRKRGLGLLAENFGASYVEQDRAARLFLYRGDLQAEWAAYPEGTQAATAAFVSGINAFVDEALTGKAPMPVEFALTDTRPAKWRPEDVVRIRSHALVSNMLAEVIRAAAVCAGGREASELLWKLEPSHALKRPEGLDPCTVPMAALQTYQLATAPVAFKAPAVLPREAPREGSNAWVVGPARTETGRAMLANDPHRALGVPSLRYVVHLEAPGLSVIGAGEPALPGVSFGHNGTIAWGLTIFSADQEDLQVYDLREGDASAYRYGKGWENIRSIDEEIPVRGEAPRKVRLQFTRHGPILATDEKRGKAFALRSVWAEPGTAGYLASMGFLTARSWRDFLKGQRRWGAPALNLVYADTAGNIGWTAAAKLPVRRNWDGLLPVPGDGRYEWAGFHRGSAFPSRYNPPAGWFASANEMNLPPDFPAEKRNLGFEWADRSRYDRIADVLARDSSVTIDDMMGLQADSYNMMAPRLLGLLKTLRGDTPRETEALRLLANWDGDERADSAAAALYQVWTGRFLGRAVVAVEAPAPARPLLGGGSLDVVIAHLQAPGEALRARRDRILLETLGAAHAELEKLLGADSSQWAWGKLHHLRLAPAVAPLADPSLLARMSVGPVPVPGSGTTPVALSYRASDFAATSGASVRIAIDVGNWDASRFVNMPGQSGDPGSPHYRDHLPIWLEGGGAPLLYSRDAVMREAERILTLSPGPSIRPGEK